MTKSPLISTCSTSGSGKIISFKGPETLKLLSIATKVSKSTDSSLTTLFNCSSYNLNSSYSLSITSIEHFDL
jgi:hypothetical protein